MILGGFKKLFSLMSQPMAFPSAYESISRREVTATCVLHDVAVTSPQAGFQSVLNRSTSGCVAKNLL